MSSLCYALRISFLLTLCFIRSPGCTASWLHSGEQVVPLYVHRQIIESSGRVPKGLVVADPGPGGGFKEPLGTVSGTHGHQSGDWLPVVCMSEPMGPGCIGGQRLRGAVQDHRSAVFCWAVVRWLLTLGQGLAGWGVSCLGCHSGQRVVCLPPCSVECFYVKVDL